MSLGAGQEKRSDQLIELEIAERLLTRFVIAVVTQRAAEESIVGSDGPVGGEERNHRGGKQSRLGCIVVGCPESADFSPARAGVAVSIQELEIGDEAI